MKVLSSYEINEVTGGFSTTSFASSVGLGAFAGFVLGGLTLPAAFAGAALFGGFNVFYQVAVSLNQGYVAPAYDVVYYDDYYYAY